MPVRRALIVDDSKSARLILKKQLEKLGLAADTAESAEAALEQLAGRLPDVIFMDHMMPGMDGFQAVREIKAEPRTRAIPILMYTTREGEDYLREALAIGADGVIGKTQQADELAARLREMGLVEAPVAAQPAATDDGTLPISDDILELAHEAEEAAQRALRRQRGESPRAPEPAAPVAPVTEAVAPVPRTAPSRARWPLTLAVVVLLAVLLIGYRLWLPTPPPPKPAPAAPAAASEPQATTPETAALLRQLARQRVRAEQEKRNLLATVAWALNRSGRYEFGDEPFDDRRLVQISELVDRLAAAGFRGTVRLNAHVGRFCLIRNDAGELILPPPQTPLRSCELLDRDTATSLGRRQSVTFANFVAANAEPGRKGIRVEIVSWGSERPLVEYPPIGAAANAGEWNALAARNQRVEIALISGN